VYNSEGTSYTAEFWQYDARIGRRWNIDPVVDPSESPYATNKNNPIKYNDPDGDCPGCDILGRASVVLTFGTRDQSRIDLLTGIGVSRRTDNFLGGINVSFNLYSGGPGTKQASEGNPTLGGAVTLGLSATYGTGQGRPTDVNIFNSSTLSGVINSFDRSLTLGTSLTLNTSTGFNRVAGYAGKLGGFTIAINEDFSFLPRGGLLASGLDEGETGGGFVGFTFRNGMTGYIGTEIFTGKPTQYPKQESFLYPGYVSQSFDQRAYNVGRTFFRLDNIPSIGNIRIDFSGARQMYSQNFIHDMIGIKRFKSLARESVQISYGLPFTADLR
jgi:hypothetical protein